MAGILVGYDGSPSARRALEHARDRALQRGDEILLLTVIGHKAFESRGLTLGPNAERILRGARVPVTVVP